MAVDWTPHRFSGGVLALDVANTVVLRLWPDKRFDRFADVAEIARFADAASLHRAAELGGRELWVASCVEAEARVLAVRETTDALFRDAASDGELKPRLLAAFLRAVADAMALSSLQREMSGASSLRFEAALGFSALSLLPPETHRRIRICPNCAWLFFDRSRNGSRTWCDMAVCGNRAKARRHYTKRQGGGVANG